MTSTNKRFDPIVQQWTSFDLKSIQNDLNVTTTEIVGNTDESDLSRRKLVELSRDYKKNTNEDVRKAITSLLKSFQIEIAGLLKQNQISEQTFIEIYQNLSELSVSVSNFDYNQILPRNSGNLSNVKIENYKSELQLDDLVDVKSEELTIKQLRDKIKDLKDKAEIIIQKHIKIDEKSSNCFIDKQHHINTIENYAQMEIHQSPIEHLHQDMFEYSTKQTDTTNDSDLLNQDYESMTNNKRTSNGERLVDEIHENIESNQTTNNNCDELISPEETQRKLREKLELDLASKERQIATLVIETQKLQSTLIKIKETSFTQISDLENVLNGKEKLIAQLENKLRSQADYDEIKRELTLLKSIEANISHHSNTDCIENIAKQSFENVLLAKNRPLQSEQKHIKSLQIDSEHNQQIEETSRHCTSPCLQRNPVSCLSVAQLTSSSSDSSSPSSPAQNHIKIHSPSAINGNENELTSKFVPSSLSIITAKDSVDSCNSISNSNYQSITSSCSTMVTPTASLLSSVPTTTTTTTALTPFNLFPNHQLSSVQCTKIHCPPTSSWSPPLSSSSVVSSIATTSTDNRTVIKSSKQASPKPSSSPTIVTPSTGATNNNLLEPLDTTFVASVVRKLLAQHNIGQRIFARYILSLSQGTVSELLSKPKCWSKLTEKGKESYRKMWCWANSEQSILTLKSISPRKGMNNRSKDSPYLVASTKHTDPVAHKKIVQMLNDAQRQQTAALTANMDQKRSLSPHNSIINDSSSQILSSDQLESKNSYSSSDSSTANSPLNESVLSDQQSFLLPVPPPPLPQPPQPSTPSTSLSPPSSTNAAASLSMFSAFVPSLLMRTANGFKNEAKTGNLMDCSSSSPFNMLCPQPDNYRNWLMLQEIVRNSDLLRQFQPTLPIPSQTSTSVDDESEQENDDDYNNDSDNDNPTSSDEIPLDLSMKIEANHNENDQTTLLQLNNKQHVSTKNAKTTLPPLREQDTSKYRYINTMELVQTVKDILSRYSISQRHFGEKILGLSQGSVSDILARPKQWESLTQKGREPFYRMRIFLDDPNAIKQLVQTVSTTATTTATAVANATISTPNSTLLPTFCPSIVPLSSTIPPSASSLLSNPSLLSTTTLNGFHSNPIDPQVNLVSNDLTHILTNDNLHPSPSSPSNGITANSNKSKSRSKPSKTNNDKSSSSSSTTTTNFSRQSANSLIPPYDLPKIPMPNTIDTEQLSSQVRELLFAYSIGQRVFGEAVLNLSQGTVSEILSKPRPWHSLSVKGREPYIRMYTWFNDSNNVQKLLAWKRERDLIRRSRPLSNKTAIIGETGVDNTDNDTINHTSTSLNSSSLIKATNNHPKRRYLFTDEQRRALKQIFENEPYPTQATLEKLSEELSLPMNKIGNWFHNSRMRTKTNIRPSSSPLNRISTLSLLNDNNNNNNNNNNEDFINSQTDDEADDDEEDIDDDYDLLNNNNNNTNEDSNDDEYPVLPTIVPLTSSWLNGTNDSNSSTSPTSLSATSTNMTPVNDDQKFTVQLSSSSLLSSSSKKRKSVPQKIITTNINNDLTKKLRQNSTLIENDSNDEADQTTNESN